MENEANEEAREAFHGSLEVLGELKRLSPQAEQYYSILMSFSEAIESYKEQIRDEKQAARGSLVDRIFYPNSQDVSSDRESHSTVVDESLATWLRDDAVTSLAGSFSEQWQLPVENDIMALLESMPWTG